MLRSTLWAACAACALLVAGGASPVLSQPPAPAAAKPAAEAIDPFEQALAANRVAEFGRRQNDPGSLIIAARMLKELPFDDAEPVDPSAPPAPFSPEGLLAEAKVMAKGDPMIILQIQLAQQSRGILSSSFGTGLLRVVKNVGARAVYTFPVKAKNGELLRIGAIGDHSSRIGMRMVDAKGKVVCQDQSKSFSPVCSFKPNGAGDYKVEVTNQGDAVARTVILSN